MTLIQRIGYYLSGFAIGLILLAFFLNGKKTSCSYGPEARVLKNINTKEIIFSDFVYSQIHNKIIDSLQIMNVLKKGNINFSESNVRQNPCGIYLVEGNYNEDNLILTVQNCDSIASITHLKIEK